MVLIFFAKIEKIAQGTERRAQSSGLRAHGAKQLAPRSFAGESRPLRREGAGLRARGSGLRGSGRRAWSMEHGARRNF